MFWHELRNIQANGLSNLGQAIQNAFDILNVERYENGTRTRTLDPEIFERMSNPGQGSKGNMILAFLFRFRSRLIVDQKFRLSRTISKIISFQKSFLSKRLVLECIHLCPVPQIPRV